MNEKACDADPFGHSGAVMKANMGNKNRNNEIHLGLRTLVFSILLMQVLLIGAISPAHAAEEKIFRTGIAAECHSFSVSPNGDFLVFSTKTYTGDMRILDLKTGEIRSIPSEPERNWGHARWSSDGKQLVAISNLVKDKKFSVTDKYVILIDAHNWSHRIISPADGVKINPFFSPDGKTVYYFKGRARTSGRTQASHYDLYSVEIASGREEKLTEESFYGVSEGDVSEDESRIYFSGEAGKNLGYLITTDPQTGHRYTAESHPLSLDVRTKRLIPIRINNPARRLFEFSRPKMNSIEELYVKAGAKGPTQYFIYSIYKINRPGEPPQKIADIPTWADFDLVKKTGEIYFPDMQHDLLIFRRLARP